MRKLSQGEPVVFKYSGVTKIGFIEKVQTTNKTKRYWIRDESGQLHQPIGLDTHEPGRILLKLTDQYFAKNEVDTKGKIVAWEEDEGEEAIGEVPGVATLPIDPEE